MKSVTDTNPVTLRIACPRCGQHLECAVAWAGKELDCPTCGQAIHVPEAEARAPGSDSNSPSEQPSPGVPAHKPQLPTPTLEGISPRTAETLRIADLQRTIIWLVLANIICFGAPVLFLAVAILQVIYMFRLARALRTASAWIFMILGCVPILGIIGLLLLNSKATEALRSRGIHVGLMGARRNDLAALKAAEATAHSLAVRSR